MASNRPRRKKQEEVQETKTPKGKLNNMELLGIGFFCIAFVLYGISKCGKSDSEVNDSNQAVVTEVVVDSTANAVADSTSNNGSSFSSGNNPAPSQPTVVASNPVAPRSLYIIADSLRVRKEPNLGGELITYLSYGEEVMDLGEQTALEKLRVSPDEVRTAPWIKIKTKKGKIGWAFGAYIQFYPVAKTTNTGSINNQ